MRLNLRSKFISLLLLTLIMTSGCAPKSALQARAMPGRPNSAIVEDISIPYDSVRPRFALMIDSTTCDGQIAAQLATTLARVGNFALYDMRLWNTPSPQKGEVGPYVVRATVTEYNETAESESETSGFSFGWLGFAAAVAGAVTGEPGLFWSGVGVAAANPGYHESSTHTVGMVGLDVQIIEYRSNRIISSFPASGRFVSVHEQSSLHVLGIGDSSERSASSALGQAQRIALNEVARKTLDVLSASDVGH